MISDPRVQRDGAASVLGGVDSSRLPSLLDPSQLAFAGNIIVRGGFAASRPGFTQLPLSFPNVEVAEWFENHVFQAGIIFSPNNRSEIHVASIGGRIFTADPADNFSVQEITPTKLTVTVDPFAAPAVGGSVSVKVTDFIFIKVGYPIIIGGAPYMVTSTSGNIITVTKLDATVGTVTAGTTVVYMDPNSATIGRAWMVQAEIFLIIQDGQSRAIIYDGSKTFRSNITLSQVPTGTVMAYAKGRLWVAVNDGMEFVAGDIVRGPLPNGAVSTYSGLDNLLYFTENLFLAGGGAFSIPVQSGRITAMQFMAVLDTSTGNGPLLIFTEKAAFSVDASAIRSEWENVRSPVQTVVLVGTGAQAQASTVNTTNSDVFFRRDDGIGSFVLAYRQFTNMWGNTPLSNELDRIIQFDEETLLKYGSAIQFNNRLLFTLVPQPTQYSAYHLAIGSLDFDPISTMYIKSPPVYDGIWTKLKVTYLVVGKISGVSHGFAWARNDDGKNELWEISRRNDFDNTDDRINSFLETRAVSGRNPTELKSIRGAEVWLDDVKGMVEFTLRFKADQTPCWSEWGRQQSVCANFRDCPAPDPTCTIPITYRPAYKTRLNFGQPPILEGSDDKPAHIGYEFQLRLEWSGHCRIRKLVILMGQEDEEPYPVVL